MLSQAIDREFNLTSMLGFAPFKPELNFDVQGESRERYDVDTQNWRDMQYVRLRWPSYEFVARPLPGLMLCVREADRQAMVVPIPEKQARRYVRLWQRAGMLPVASQ